MDIRHVSLIVLLWAVSGTTHTCAAEPPPAAQVRYQATQMQISTSLLRWNYDKKTGQWRVEWALAKGNKPMVLRGASGAATLADGTALTIADYPRHTCEKSDVTPIADAFGKGTRITVHHGGLPGKPELRQHFQVYPALPYLLTRLEVVSTGAPVTVSNLMPVLLDAKTTPDAGLHLDTGDVLPCTLLVPYDNDAWIRYHAQASESYEVSAIYDNASRHGFVVGSVTHDLWKTGLFFGEGHPRRLGSLEVCAGRTGKETRDSQPHGTVSGTMVASPLIFIGAFSDWRDGMEAYARANASLQPPLTWTGTGGVPFGWNSWAAYKDKVTQEGYLAASDFVKASLQPHGFGDTKGDVYINLDSFWDNLSDTQIADAVKYVHANGQKAGIYWTPFVCWGGDLSRPVEGTEGRFTYQDILLKDASGTPLPKLDGGIPIDPTHPGALLRIDALIKRFVDWGFDFIKLDFLTHGALEGKHDDPKITTGTGAYNLGMRRIVADLDPARIGRPFFISLSIAPLFPTGYGHSRRISCDAAGGVGATEYMLNSLTYGWWAQSGLYRFTDPDHTVLYQERGEGAVTEAEAKSRLIASVIAGGMLLDSDDLQRNTSKERVQPLLTHPELLALARKGQAFRPVEGNTGDRATDTFLWEDAATHQTYVALFNFSRTEERTANIPLSRLGLGVTNTYTVHDLWTGQDSQAQQTLSPRIAPLDAVLLRVSSK